jgi:hypothetical protein
VRSTDPAAEQQKTLRIHDPASGNFHAGGRRNGRSIALGGARRDIEMIAKRIIVPVILLLSSTAFGGTAAPAVGSDKPTAVRAARPWNITLTENLMLVGFEFGRRFLDGRFEVSTGFGMNLLSTIGGIIGCAMASGYSGEQENCERAPADGAISVGSKFFVLSSRFTPYVAAGFHFVGSRFSPYAFIEAGIHWNAYSGFVVSLGLLSTWAFDRRDVLASPTLTIGYSF